MLTVTLVWAARHTTQPCVTTTRTGTVRCDHHSDDDPIDENVSAFPAPPRSVINTQAQVTRARLLRARGRGVSCRDRVRCTPHQQRSPKTQPSDDSLEGINDTAPASAETWQQSATRTAFDAAEHVDRAGGGHGSSTARPPSAGATSTRPPSAAAGAHRLRLRGSAAAIHARALTRNKFFKFRRRALRRPRV